MTWGVAVVGGFGSAAIVARTGAGGEGCGIDPTISTGASTIVRSGIAWGMRCGGMLATVICCFGRGLLTVYTNAPVAAKPAVHTSVVTAKMVAFVMSPTKATLAPNVSEAELLQVHESDELGARDIQRRAHG